MTIKPKILIVDDEAPIRRMLKASLPETDFDLIEACTGREGIAAVASYNPEVAIFDLGLPDKDGVECIKEIREWSQVPIIVLSARGEETTKVKALDAGAHDYVTKPFSVPELIARIKVALRFSKGSAPFTNFESQELQIDFADHRVIVRGSEVHLTPLEFKLLTFLTQHANRVLTHHQIISEVWGPAHVRETHYLRILMKSLRHKIEKEPTRPSMLITETGIGYRFRT